MAERVLLTSQQMATFVARGFLRFESVVPDDINQQFLDEVGRPPQPGEGDAQGVCEVVVRQRHPDRAGRHRACGQLSAGFGDHADAESAGRARRDRKPRWTRSALRPSLPARDVSAGVLRSARAAERFAAHASGFDDRSTPRVRHSDHVLPARRHARDGRHAVRARHASARSSAKRRSRVIRTSAASSTSCVRQARCWFCITASGTAAASTVRIGCATCSRSASTPPFVSSGCGIRPICRTITTSSGRSS